MVWNDHERSGQPGSESAGLPTLGPGEGSADRTPLVAAISKDEGQTWVQRRCLEDSPGHGFCYTAIYFVDGAVLLAYCAGGKETNGVLNRLRMRRIDVDWFYGK